MSPKRDLLGAVLVGGASRRMGRDKALLPIAGRPLAEHVARVLEEVLSEVVLVGARGEDDSRFPGRPVLADRFPGRGPLAGLHTALLHAGGRPVFLAACDLPGIRPGLVRHVAGSGELEGPTARIPVMDGRLQPLAAAYAPGCLALVEDHLRRGWLALHRLTGRLTVVELPLTPELPFWHQDLLSNINRREDYRRLAPG